MRIVTWWIDRWRKSTAYTDFSLAEQGAYRNLLDEVYLRPDGVIPDASIARASGDAGAWPGIKRHVLSHMKRVPGGWTHETALTVKSKSVNFSESQRVKAIKRWSQRTKLHDAGAYAGHHAHAMPPDPDPNICTEDPGTPIDQSGRTRASVHDHPVSAHRFGRTIVRTP